MIEDRPCHAKADHVPHPWDGGRRWCRGAGKYADDGLTALADPAGRCQTTWTGPTGVVWDCVGTEHYSDPAAGLCGSGHTMRARQRVS